MSRVPELVFYDGSCGFCHGTVRFLLREDPEGALFRFAPIAGETFQKEVPAEERGRIPDSVVVLTAEGSVLVWGEALLHILVRLGGRWERWAARLQHLPAGLLDVLYRGFARVRHLFARRPETACPLVPPELRGRFLA